MTAILFSRHATTQQPVPSPARPGQADPQRQRPRQRLATHTTKPPANQGQSKDLNKDAE